ncbi:hypothetical protein [Desulfovibrio aminophilus]|uniref:hypothetical protein n=1 Tax=Desulfovibrio aminophilus TaxID=81425 RepID=UPI00040AA20C|nr:hypothetical protein [Desulfovibrio aminophilus]
MILPALSIRQPWAALIALGLKDIENRSWCCPNKHIGHQVLLHASKQPCPWEPDYSRRGSSMPVWQAAQLAYNRTTGQLLPWHTLNPMSQALDLGGIVGVATISFFMRATDPDVRISPWCEPGKWWWKVSNALPLRFWPCPGRLGFFQVDYPYPLQEAA